MRVLLALAALPCALAQVPTLEELGAAFLPANESAGNPPTVTNFFGSLALSSDPLDPLGVASFDAFPYVGWLRTRLTAEDGSGAQRVLAASASRWLAHRAERRAGWPGAAADWAAVSASVAHRFLVYLRESVAKGEGLTDADERVMAVAAEMPASSPAASPADAEHDGSGLREASEGADGDGAFAVGAAAPAAAAACEDAPAPASSPSATTVEHVSGLEAEAAGPVVGCLSLRGLYSPRAELERDFFARLLFLVLAHAA
jgi:hypothetical protein